MLLLFSSLLFPLSDFTLTSPTLDLMPEQRHFPHFVTSYLDGTGEVFIFGALVVSRALRPLNNVCISLKVGRSSRVQSV